MYSFESPRRVDSNKYMQHIFGMNKFIKGSFHYQQTPTLHIYLTQINKGINWNTIFIEMIMSLPCVCIFNFYLHLGPLHLQFAS